MRFSALALFATAAQALGSGCTYSGSTCATLTNCSDLPIGTCFFDTFANSNNYARIDCTGSAWVLGVFSDKNCTSSLGFSLSGKNATDCADAFGQASLRINCTDKGNATSTSAPTAAPTAAPTPAPTAPPASSAAALTVSAAALGAMLLL